MLTPNALETNCCILSTLLPRFIGKSNFSVLRSLINYVNEVAYVDQRETQGKTNQVKLSIINL